MLLWQHIRTNWMRNLVSECLPVVWDLGKMTSRLSLTSLGTAGIIGPLSWLPQQLQLAASLDLMNTPHMVFGTWMSFRNVTGNRARQMEGSGLGRSAHQVFWTLLKLRWEPEYFFKWILFFFLVDNQFMWSKIYKHKRMEGDFTTF